MHRLQALRGRNRPWILAILVVALLAGHAVILRYVLSNLTLSAAMFSGAAVLLLIKHLGLFGSLYAAVRRRSRIK
jgi:hypothetical protein